MSGFGSKRPRTTAEATAEAPAAATTPFDLTPTNGTTISNAE